MQPRDVPAGTRAPAGSRRRGRPEKTIAHSTSAAAHDSHVAPTDALILAFLVWLAGVVLASHPAPAPLLATMGFLAVVTVVGALHAARSPARSAVHDFLPVATVIVLFELLGPVIPAVNAARWDDVFARLDARWFGRLPEAWFGLLGRPAWLVDLAALAYVAYYVLPVAIAGALYHQGRRAEFRAFSLIVVGTLLASYAGYLFFPTVGPRLEPTHARALGGGAITRAVSAFVQAAEGNQLDAFPSGHTAVSLVTLALGWRVHPRWRAVFVPIVGGVVFSTVYLSYHYVVDVVAGAALAGGALALLRPFARRLRSTPDEPTAVTARRRRDASVRARA